jgi:hypothetical protein
MLTKHSFMKKSREYRPFLRKLPDKVALSAIVAGVAGLLSQFGVGAQGVAATSRLAPAVRPAFEMAKTAGQC